MLRTPKVALAAATLGVLAWPAEASANVVTDWNTIAADLVASNQDQGTQTHTLAIVHIAIHDALNAIDHRYQPYEYLGDAPGASAPAAVAAAARDTLVALIPSVAATIDADYAAALAAIPDGTSKDEGIATGQDAAAAVLQLRSGDDLYAAAMQPYTPGSPAPGVYQLTPPLNFVVNAGWGALAPFAISSGSQFRSPTPLSVTSVPYAVDYNEVKSLGSATSTTRTAEQSQTAKFWYDAGTKEWNRAATTGLAQVNADDWRAARVLALLNIGIADAVIASFDTKYQYSFWRPITAIRAGATDGNPFTAGDESWQPYCVTPPFPEYNSTHAAVAGVVAATLERELGDVHTYTIDSPTLPGVSRTYNRFSVGAFEMALSRIYCGIHYRTSMYAGLAQGALVAAYAEAHVLQPL